MEVRGGHRASARPAIVRRGRRAGGPPAPGTARAETGAVTAEAAAVLPVLVALCLGLVWCLSLVVAQVRVVDGAREVARVGARGDGDAVAVRAGRQVAPDGASVRLERHGDTVVAVVRVRVRGPGGVFRHLPAPTVHSRAVAAAEPS
ncbi:pilus assembly protein [Nocardioides marmoribigeumensis]|uniref:TadE-like domain-containing protein n=1 Tax=Nocardioides marmoribigeumensis TaxID=433649 RepID=A0ABU2BW24_9ACTN|nr:pilus assembly protein [Nocardioides marmoribigeumensis]MDR7362832.1 hypothetical protein [Nocardioides marmoribigeumensis]